MSLLHSTIFNVYDSHYVIIMDSVHSVYKSSVEHIPHAQPRSQCMLLGSCLYILSTCWCKLYTVDFPNNGHFGTWASVLYSGSVLYWGVLVKHFPLGVNNAVDTLDSTITHF